MSNTKPVEINARGRVRAVVFLEDGKYILSGGDEAMIRQWRIDDGVEVGEGMKAGSLITAMDLSGDGKWIVSGGQRVANVWSMRSRQIVITVSEHSDWVDAIHVSPDSTRFATGSNDKRAYIWDILTGTRLVGPLEHEDRVAAVRFSPDGNRIATGTAAGMLRIYDTRNGGLLRTIPVSVASYPNPIAWPSDQSILVLVSQNTLVDIDINEGQSSSSWTVPGDPANHFSNISLGSVLSSGNGRVVVSFVGYVVSLWDTSTSARISSDIRCPSHVRSIALSPDNKYLSISDTNGKITLRVLKDIVSDYYLVNKPVSQQPKVRGGDGLQSQIEALQGQVRALGLRVDELGRKFTDPQDPQASSPPPTFHPAGAGVFGEAPHVEEWRPGPPGFFDGTYRIRSNICGLYLTCSQDGAIIMQSLNQSNSSQIWTVSFVGDGAYDISNNTGVLDALLNTGRANTLVWLPRGEHSTAWTIEPRGNSYVIGNSTAATAIHLRTRHQTVSVSIRDNSPNQRWNLERVMLQD